MASSKAHLNTPYASRYLQQLCKHFGHKVPVEFTPQKGRVDLPFGACRMAADETQLDLIVEGEADGIKRLERFVGDHLERFAFREKATVTWTALS